MKTLTVISILIFCSNFATAQISQKCNGIRIDDEIVKQQVIYKDPGRSGNNVIWNFSELQPINDEYKLSYSSPRVLRDSLYVLGRDTFLIRDVKEGELLVGTEHSTMYYYRLKEDKLLLLGYENPLNLFHHTEPVVSAAYALKTGQNIENSYQSKGLYSGKESIRTEGLFHIEDDAYGMLILPSGNTLYNVTRQKMIRTAKTPVRVSDQTGKGEKAETLSLEFENYKWYVKGYRYPVFETSRSFSLRDTVRTETFATAFFYPPQEHYYLDEDEVNDSILSKQLDEKRPARPDASFDGSGGLNYNIFPNPVENTLFVEYMLKESTDITISLYDISSKMIYHKSFSNQEPGFYSEEVDCMAYPKGNYVFRLTAGDVQVTEKISKH